jgi:flagellar biosynthetic protein FlhB
VVALVDYVVQLRRHEKSLKMTRQEVTQESRDTDGDPMIKARIRAMARANARKRMLQAVPKADVVVVNPIHIAVALRYDTSVAAAPIVVAMGERLIAERIKDAKLK